MLLSKEQFVKLYKYSRLKFGVLLGMGALIALALCVQCVRTYLYIDAVLVPQQAEREAERQQGALTTAARSAGISDAHALGPAVQRTMEAAGDRVRWIRVLDPKTEVLAQSGSPHERPNIPANWWEKVEAHKSLGTVVDEPEGKALVALLPFRMPRPPHPPEAGSPSSDPSEHPPGARHPGAYIVELAIPLNAVAGAFEGLRQNLIVGLAASIALSVSLAIIGLRAPHYLRGRYLESELELARRVQNDLWPQPQTISPHIEFGAAAVAADHVGGDFYDIFEVEAGKVAVVLGDVSGKGVPAALLVSVLQGAIRSSTASQHETACERINKMLCERTACERFATLFWGVFDPVTSMLRYVNAGHAAPMLIRRRFNRLGASDADRSAATTNVMRLDEGGPVLGLLGSARYSAGTVKIEPSDTLVLYSDGINEATNQHEEEFGEERIERIVAEAADEPATEVCEQVMRQVALFASSGAQPDDRTLLVARFGRESDARASRTAEEIWAEAAV